jgi:hypothetical protein
VLIGSAQKMGTGTNVQKRLAALQHLADREKIRSEEDQARREHESRIDGPEDTNPFVGFVSAEIGNSADKSLRISATGSDVATFVDCLIIRQYKPCRAPAQPTPPDPSIDHQPNGRNASLGVPIRVPFRVHRVRQVKLG